VDALEFIGMIRSRHQLRLAREGRSIDNHAPLAELSPADKTRLRGAFLRREEDAGRHDRK